jgi:hypothetical protein
MHLARRIPVRCRVTETKVYNGAVASIPPRSTGHGRRLARRRSTRLSTELRTFLKKIRLRDGVKTGVVRALIRRSVRPPPLRSRGSVMLPCRLPVPSQSRLPFFFLSRGHRSFRAFASFSFIFSSIHHKAFAIIILQLARFCRGKKNRASRRLRHGHS